MKPQQTLPQTITPFGLLAALAVLGAGCAGVKANRTVALPGLPALAGAKSVRVIERREEVTQPYQVVGQVTVHRSGTMLTKGTSLDRMRPIAAAMGADGLIGFTESHGAGKNFGIGSGYAWVHSCLAVKWLSPGQKPQPVSVPMVVGLLPSSAAKDHAKSVKMVHESASALLGLKGYYPIPLAGPVLKGGLDELKTLGDAELMAVGGAESQLLLDLSVVDAKQTYAVVGNNVKAQIQVSILDKQTRSYVLQETHQQSDFEVTILGGGVVPFTWDQHRREVFERALISALQQLKPIATVVD